MKIFLTQDLLHAVQLHGETSYPEEGAGIILGRVLPEGRKAEVILPQTNRFHAQSRHNRYMIEAREMLAAEVAAEELGLEIIGVFHSHPDHPAKPSEYDRQWALPWYSYLITQIDPTGAVETRSWRLSEDRLDFSPEKIEVTKSDVAEERS